MGIKATRSSNRLTLVRYKKRSVVRLIPKISDPSIAVTMHNIRAIRRFRARGVENSCSAIRRAADIIRFVAKNFAPKKAANVVRKSR